MIGRLSLANLECPSVKQLWNVHQSWNIWNVWNAKAGRIDVPLAGHVDFIIGKFPPNITKMAKLLYWDGISRVVGVDGYMKSHA